MLRHDNFNSQIFPMGPATLPGNSIRYQYVSIRLLPFNNPKVEHSYAAIKFTAYFRSCFTRMYKYQLLLLFSNLHAVSFLVCFTFKLRLQGVSNSTDI